MNRSPLKALFLPPMAWAPEFDSFVSGGAPDPTEVYTVLRENGIEAEIMDPHPKPWNPFSGKNTLFDSMDVTRALRVLATRRNIDIAVSIFEGAALPLIFLRGAAGFRPPVVLWDVGLTEEWKLRERVLDRTLPSVDAIMVLGTNQKHYIEKRWAPKSPVDVIFHHVDVNFFRAAPDVPDGYILSVGKDHGRDFETLLKATQGTTEPLCIKTTKAIAARLGLRPDITWALKYQSYAELRDVYAGARFVVVPLCETLNASGVSTILEAYSMGRALIVSDTQAMRDYIVPGETCLTVPVGDAEALRGAMAQLSSDAALRGRLAQAGRRFVEGRFANRAFATGLAKTLRSYAS